MATQYSTRIRFRRDTAQNWEDANPILAQGEMGLLIPARKYKLGDGITRWNDLEFATTGDGYGTHQVGYLTCTTPANEPTKQVQP